jgi:hypothetical protein
MNGSPIAPKILSCSIEEAKHVAAEHALNQLGLSTTVMPVSNEFFNQSTLVQSPNQMNYHNLITNTTSNQQLLCANTPVSNSAPPSRQPEYVPIVAAPYFFDPTSLFTFEIIRHGTSKYSFSIYLSPMHGIVSTKHMAVSRKTKKKIF